MLNAARVVALAVLLAWLLPARSEPPLPAPRKDSQPQQQHPTKADQEAKTDKTDTAPSLPIQVVIAPRNANSHAYQDGDNRGKESAFGYSIEAISAFVTAIATALIAVFTIVLACSTKRLWREAKITSRIAFKSAVTAKKTVDMMETTAKRQLRAYVAIEKIYFVTRPYDSGAGDGATIGMFDPSITTDDLRISPKNYGQTPALEMSIYCLASVFPPEQRTIEVPLFGRQMFHPSMVQSYHIPSPPHRQEFHVWGHLIYRDAYKRWWRTNFWYSHQRNNVFIPERERNEEKGPYDIESDAVQDINESPTPEQLRMLGRHP